MSESSLPNEPHPINDPAYWKERLEVAIKMENIHQAIYMCGGGSWVRIENKHKEILQRVILPTESILDLGCGWGRLLSLLPSRWRGSYLGIDLSPDFIKMAKETYPGTHFICGPIEVAIPQLEIELDDKVGFPPLKYDWCVFVSIREMIILNNGREAWSKIEALARRVSKRLLFLEYSLDDSGSIE